MKINSSGMSPAHKNSFMVKSKISSEVKHSLGERIFNVFNVALITTLCFLMIYPFWYVLIYSLNTSSDAAMGGLFFLPRQFTFANYKYVILNPMVLDAFIITALRTILGSVLNLAVTGFVAYALSKKTLPGRKAFTYFFMIPMFIGGTMISNYLVIAKIGLIDNFLVYIIPWSFNFFYMIVIKTFIENLPPDIEESAKLDGANYFTIFFRLVIPLCTPVIATILIYSGVGYWLDYSANLIYIGDKKLNVLQYILYLIVINSSTSEMMYRMTQSGSMISRQFTADRVSTESLKVTTLVVATIPITIVYPFLQKYFIKGMLVGAVKG